MAQKPFLGTQLAQADGGHPCPAARSPVGVREGDGTKVGLPQPAPLSNCDTFCHFACLGRASDGSRLPIHRPASDSPCEEDCHLPYSCSSSLSQSPVARGPRSPKPCFLNRLSRLPVGAGLWASRNCNVSCTTSRGGRRARVRATPVSEAQDTAPKPARCARAMSRSPLPCLQLRASTCAAR